MAGGTPRFSMTAQPASVVPFGVATIRNNCIGSRPSIKRSSAVPFIVWRASLYATSRGNPDRTPPSIIECARAAMNPGPLPLRPVTASSIGSSTIVTRPIAPKNPPTTSATISGGAPPHQNPRGRDDPPHDQAPDERFAHLAHARDSDCLLGLHEIRPAMCAREDTVLPSLFPSLETVLIARIHRSPP